MFGNFIFFIVALLIYTIYQPTDDPYPLLSDSLLIAGGLSLVFAAFTRHQFNRLIGQIDRISIRQLDNRFSSLMTRHSILSLGVYAVDIHILNLPSYTNRWHVIDALPTLDALLFLSLFIAHLAIVWAVAYDAQNRLYPSDISRKTYVYSHFSFSVPILLPWLILSGAADLIRILPFEWPRQIIDTTVGQIVYFMVFLMVAAIFGPLMIQRFWGCRPLESGPFRQRIEALCQRAGLRYADILYWPIFGGRMMTAAVMGLVGRFRYILVTDALLRLLTAEQVDAVIAHEIGHIKRRHLVFYLLFFIGFMIVSYATLNLIIYVLIFAEPVFSAVSRFDINPTTVTTTVYALLLFINVIVYFRFIFGYFMRNFERQADTYVYRLFPNAVPLIETFNRIVVHSGQPADKPNWHHFSIRQRIDYLRKCEDNRRWVARHDHKVRRSMAVYLTAMAAVAVMIYQFNFGEAGRRLNIHVFETAMARKTVKTAEDANLYLMLGNAYFEMGKTDRAVEAYRQALALDPSHAEVLNNLAWLFATSAAPHYDPQRALSLAQQALEIKKAPHIWDTLAESLFANGRFEQAVAAENKAMAMNPEDKAIYRRQLEKFKKALNHARRAP